MTSVNRFQNTLAFNSIVNPSSESQDDQDSPFTLLQWVERTDSIQSIDQYVDEYNLYLKQWRDIKNAGDTTDKTTIKNVYIAFLKEIVMKYTSEEEKRYLKNVDFTNAAEATAAIPFFARRIRQIIQIVYRNRHQVKFQKIKHSLKGSSLGLEKMIFDTIIRFVSKENLASLQFDLPAVADVVNDCMIDFKYLYDTSQSYFDTKYLETEGGELIDPNGDMYVGYYCIEKQTDGNVVYLTGKVPTPESQQLSRVDHRIALKSNVGYVSYGASHYVDPKSTGFAY